MTGVGVVAPGEPGTKAFWELITNGRTATRRDLAVRRVGVPLAGRGRVRLRPGRRTGLGPADVLRMDRYVQFAVVAAREAVADSGLELVDGRSDPGRRDDGHRRRRHDPPRSATTSQSATAAGEWLVDHRYAGPFLYEALVPSSLASEIAVEFDAHGPAHGRLHRLHVRHRRHRLRPTR